MKEENREVALVALGLGTTDIIPEAGTEKIEQAEFMLDRLTQPEMRSESVVMLLILAGCKVKVPLTQEQRFERMDEGNEALRTAQEATSVGPPCSVEVDGKEVEGNYIGKDSTGAYMVKLEGKQTPIHIDLDSFIRKPAKPVSQPVEPQEEPEPVAS